MPLRMLKEDRKEREDEQRRRRAGRRKIPGGGTARKPSQPPRPSAGPGSLMSKPKKPKMIVTYPVKEGPANRFTTKKTLELYGDDVVKRKKGSKLTGEKGTTFKYKKRLSDKFLGSDEKRLNKIYAAGAAASRDANKISKESGKRFRGQTFKALEGPFKGITFRDTPSNRYNYERPGFFAKKKRSVYKAPDVRFKKTKFLTGGQAKIAAKAPPADKIDGKDFAVLRAEKAKGRGQGLQDEKMKPGKVMKANLGLMFMKKAKDKGAKGAEFLSPLAMLKRISGKKSGGKIIKARKGRRIKKDSSKPINPFEKKSSKFLERRKKLMGLKNIVGKGGRVGAALTALTIAGAGAAKLGQMLGKKMTEKKDKKMGGGMMKKYSVGGGADSGRIGELKSDLATAKNKTERIAAVKKADKARRKMGGGMMQRPMGMMKKGSMVKARGGGMARTKPTKMF